MKGRFFLGKYLIWVILVLGQLHGYNGCVEKERKALLELEKYIISITIEEYSDYALPTWTYNTKSDCCRWEGVKCNRTSKRVTEIAFGTLSLKENSLLNLSLLHPFEDIRSLNLSRNDYYYNQFSGLFDDVEGYKTLRKLRKLEIMDLSRNRFNNSIFPFLNSAISLKTLFLGDNNFYGGPLPAKELKDLTNLELLDLSGNRFNGSIPVQELSALSKLKSLDLSRNEFSELSKLQGYKSVRRLRNLKILDLSENNFDNNIFSFLSALTSLTTLFLRSNYIGGPFPVKEFKDLTNLELLDLSKNKLNGSIPMQELSALKKLEALDLSDNKFSGSIELQGICEMKNMQDLDLSGNKLVGQFPLCLTRLTGLQVLDLSSNQLNGNVPSALGKLESLKYLSLSDNNFEGSFPLDSLANLSELRLFKLSSRSNSFKVESGSSWRPKFQLSHISLPSCNLVKVPHFLLYQKDLSHIDLSDNTISGSFPTWLLANNTKLEVLLLQNNSFTSFQLPNSAHKLLFMDVSLNEFNHLFPENIGWVLPHLVYMKLANNGFQGNLPSSLGNIKSIEFLDLSHNNFHGELPRSFVMNGYFLKYLKLSHNKLSGEVFPEFVNFTVLWELSMDNNMFTGKIGEGLRNTKYLQLLDISNNNLTGVIPSWIGEFPSLVALQVSNNSLEGEIPISLFYLPYLLLMDLSANILSGDISPRVKSNDLTFLFLQDNHLSGEIPYTLVENLYVLDLRNNRLSGNIPQFTSTQNIHTLLLRGNNLTGSISRQLCGLRNIQLLDLANNRLNGSIPSCLKNTSFGFGKKYTLYDDDYSNLFIGGGTSFIGFSPQKDFGVNEFQDTIYFRSRILLHPFQMSYSSAIGMKIEFAVKHRYDAYVGKNLNLLFGLDISENELSGNIPSELGSLLELQVLNVSHNNLSGLIPESFSGLKNVESLDLSFNKLQGLIPQGLTKLSGLAVFNVSFNHLSGVIPQGSQFNTFDTLSFVGNPLLCGKPTNRSCGGSTFQEPDNGVKDDDESQIDMVSFYWSFLAPYVTILLGIFSSLSFDSPWRRFWFYVVDVFIHKVRNLLC
ncbi:receptor-like protein 13 isoform X2 [Brassica rapa]|uniref:receptor-like protein 13 isoform X2 n=1 Tax=Brassica campestris TaxID=3711 RepID=UPI0004F1A8EF|nr:receptor-like protein 13 isoform X2 [Brassica rapa]